MQVLMREEIFAGGVVLQYKLSKLAQVTQPHLNNGIFL